MSNSRARLVTTWGALITGVASILLPFTYSTSPKDATFDGDLWPVATPFYLAILIGLASLRLARSALASARMSLAAWTAAAASSAVTMYFVISSMLREAPSQAWDWFGITVLVAALGAGAVLVLRRRGGGRCILAMQVAYAANALWCLLAFAGEWQSGAWCALVTVVIYVAQVASDMNRRVSVAARQSNGSYTSPHQHPWEAL